MSLTLDGSVEPEVERRENCADIPQTNHMSAAHIENAVPERHPDGDIVTSGSETVQGTAEETSADAAEASPVEKFAYGMHKEAEFDNPALYPGLKNDPGIVKFDSQNPELINHATVKALIVQLTSPEIVDYDLICDFFLTYRMFVNTDTVMDLLLTRLIWALQHIKSTDTSKNRIGQLVLLRSFVVLRHWILNYFVDDFNSNFTICDRFTTTINDIIFNSNLIDVSDVFVTKILSDLKTHWLSSIIEFWDLGIDLSVISSEVYNYCLPLTAEVSITNKMTKSSTEMSLHTNPSYRRSAMLSLYDQKTYHKCLVIDDAQNDDNPQLSVNNLLLKHQSSRQSINKILQTYNEHEHSDSNKASHKPLSNSTKHNRMNLKDSSIALKKTRKNESRRGTHYDVTVNNSTYPLTPMHLDNVGFATNGVIQIPSSKVNEIVPSTPVRKMEYTIRPPNHEFTSRNFLEGLDLNRKKSLKKIVDSWKKSLHHNKYRAANEANEVLHNLINDALSKSEYANLIGDRFDVLSARIVDELEFLIRGYLQNESTNHSVIHEADGNEYTTVYRDSGEPKLQTNDELDIDDFDSGLDLVNCPEQQSPHRSPQKSPANDLEEDVDINDLSELNLRKIDNLINEGEAEDFDDQEFRSASKKNVSNEILSENFMNDIHEFSFQRPTSLNWSYENEIELETSQTKQRSLDSSRSQDPSSHNTDLKEPQLGFNHSNKSFVSSISTPSNITQYHAEIQELGIAVSPTSNNSHARRISFHDSVTERRFSKASSNSILRRDSAKSYLSYDSAFSVSRGVGYDRSIEGHLRKKAGVNDLRTLAGVPVERQSLDKPVRIMSTSSRISAVSNRRSIRVSTLFALTQLPFNHSDDSRSSINFKRFTRASDLGDSSVFSIALRSAHISKETNEEGTEGETFEKSSSSSGGSVAIPGISHHVLKELAAIPDESFNFNDPVGFALHKLEGKNIGSEDPEGSPSLLSQETHVDNTEEILNAINNANTEDVIEHETTNREFTPEPPLTPVVDSKDESPMTSTPMKKKETETPNNDTTASAQNENVFGSGANYSDPTTTGSRSLHNSRAHKTPKVILDAYSLVNESLLCSNIINNNLHISFIFAHNSQSLAEHFTVIERDILQEIDWKELIEIKWNKDIRPVSSWLEIIVNEEFHSSNKGVNLAISRFNLMVNWIISQVLLTKNRDERIKIIRRFIHIGQDCLELQNYSTLMQIILALTSEKVTKLRETWNNLPPGDILMLKSLERLASPMKNFMNLRVSINQIQPSKGCIPFVGLYLSDLIFNTERPKFIASKTGEEQLVNFSRFRTSVHIVKSLSQCIEWSAYYQLEIDPKLLSKCLYLKSLDEEEMNYCVAAIDSP